MESFGKLLNCFDRQTAFAVHERAERCGVYARFRRDRGVRAFILFDCFPKLLQKCHEIHDKSILAT